MTEWTLCTSNAGAFWILDGFDGDSGDLAAAQGSHRDLVGGPGGHEAHPGHEERQARGLVPQALRSARSRQAGRPGYRPAPRGVDQDAEPRREFGHVPWRPPWGQPCWRSPVLGANIQLHETGLTGAGIIHPTKGGTWTEKHMDQVTSMLASPSRVARLAQDGGHQPGDIEITPIGDPVARAISSSRSCWP